MTKGMPPKKPLPLLDPDVLRTFIAIAEAGSFAAAAAAVARTPAAVSMQIKKLEEQLGRTLFNRDSRSVSLTRDGEMLIGDARRLLALNRETVARFVCPDVSGIVRLGAPDDVSERRLPGMLRRFAETHPGVTVDVVVENSAPLLRSMAAGDIDVAVITCDEAFDDGPRPVEILMREPLVWATLKGGIAAGRDPLPLSVWEEGCVWRKAGIEGLERQGRAYRVAFRSAYIAGQRAAILADLAVAPLPVSCLSETIVEADPRYRLPKLPDYRLGLAVAPGAGPAAQAAADHIRASFLRAGQPKRLPAAAE